MRIIKVSCMPFQNPMKSFQDAYTRLDVSRAVLVRIETDQGMVGYGEASAWQPEFYGETLESITSAINKYIAPWLLDQNPLDIGPRMAQVDGIFARSPCVKEGIDLALYDLAGKILGVPVSTLLNGRYREWIPVTCEIGIDTPAAMAQEALRLINMGVRTLKIKGSHQIEEDIGRIKAIRETVGNAVDIRLDPNAHWTVHGTVRAMRLVEDCRLQLLEQPVASWDYDGMAHIRSMVGIPVMADESVWSPQDVLRIARHRAADIINIKISKTGGLLMAKKIEAIAEAEGLSCIVGTELEPGFSHAAKLHLAASIRNLDYACDFSEIAMLTKRMIDPDFMLREGCLPVPSEPGLGVHLDEAAFREMMVILS